MLLGTRIDRHKKTARSEQGGFFMRSGASVSLFPLRRISTPHIINIINVTKREMLSIRVLQLSHVPILYNQLLKKHHTYAKSSAFYKITIVRGVVLLFIFSSFLHLFSPGKDKLMRPCKKEQKHMNRSTVQKIVEREGVAA